MGIKKRADPIEKLERIYTSFKARTGEIEYAENIPVNKLVKQNGTLKVYTDEMEDLKVKVFPGCDEVWDEFGTNVEARKENKKIVETMAGSKFLQNKTKSGIAVEDAFSVFTDNVLQKRSISKSFIA